MSQFECSSTKLSLQVQESLMIGNLRPKPQRCATRAIDATDVRFALEKI